MKKLFALSLVSSTILVGCGGESYQIDSLKVPESAEYYQKVGLEKWREAVRYCQLKIKTIDSLYSYLRGKDDEAILQFERELKPKFQQFKSDCENIVYKAQEIYSKEERDKNDLAESEKINAERSKRLALLDAELNKYKDMAWDKAIRIIITESEKNGIRLDSNREYDTDKERWVGSAYEKPLVYVYNVKAKEGVETLNKLPYAELDTSHYCNTDRRYYSACEIATYIFKQKKEQVINDYSTNLGNLKKDYNLCVQRVEDYIVSKTNNVQTKDDNLSFEGDIKKYEESVFKEPVCSATEESLKLLNIDSSRRQKLVN